MAFMERFCEWKPYRLICGAMIDGVETPTPFNFRTIDQFFPQDRAEMIKAHIDFVYGTRKTVTVLEALECSDSVVRDYAQWLFEKDYRPYTAKQWGIPPSEIDPSVLKRVPLRLSYEEGYYDDAYQVLPATSYKQFFDALLDHPNIRIELGVDATSRILVNANRIEQIDGVIFEKPIIYTGALDELFGYSEGCLPYRSLRFNWVHENIESFQSYPVVAHPQVEGYTRITEYKKFPVQNIPGTTYAIEYPQKYSADSGAEPYYPIPTKESQVLYEQYLTLAAQISQLHPCGRLADFRYYNMDQALARALEVADSLAV
jgi:UDP-galactopyranose mutase